MPLLAGTYISLTAPALSAQSLSAQESGQTLFKNVRVFDGTRAIGTRDVLVSAGKIAAISSSLRAPTGATIVDGSGSTLLPGLIDSHTHVFGDALEQALAFGVTTELDMFSDPGEGARLRAEQKAHRVAGRADIYSAGVLVTAPKRHGTEYGFPIPTLASPDSALAFVDARIAEGSDYIKIVLDDGSTYGIQIPTLACEELRAVVLAAHARGKLAVVHVGSLADAREAIDAGADGLEHLFVDRAPDAGFGAFVAAHHAFVVPTQPTNLSAAQALTFWTKGDGKTYQVMLFSESRGRMPSTRDFVAGPDWKEYTFPLASFDGIDGHDIMGIAFTNGPDAGTFQLRIDQVALK